MIFKIYTKICNWYKIMNLVNKYERFLFQTISSVLAKRASY